MNEREAVTIRFPRTVLAHARAAKGSERSLNEFVVRAVEREARRARALAVLDEIDKLREAIAARTGIQPDSTPLIRQLRQGRGRRD